MKYFYYFKFEKVWIVYYVDVNLFRIKIFFYLLLKYVE